MNGDFALILALLVPIGIIWVVLDSLWQTLFGGSDDDENSN